MKRGNEVLAVSGVPIPPDMARRRSDFPILRQRVHGKPLVYLDNASTTQKPRSVIEAITRYYETTNANVHRGVHVMSERATQAYEEARSKVARFLHAQDDREIIFVRAPRRRSTWWRKPLGGPGSGRGMRC